MHLWIQVVDKNGAVVYQGEGEHQAALVHRSHYREGDRIVLQTDGHPCHLVVQLEDSMPQALVYLKAGRHDMPVPLEERGRCYSPKSFSGSVHLLTARRAAPWEIGAYRNLALNPYDFQQSCGLFPHVTANAETRNESVFAARNAIDGIAANEGHGEWPYQSWGINRDPNAGIRLEFGRAVWLDRAVITTRADFPHDAWWVEGTLSFSQGDPLAVPLTKTALPQAVEFPPRPTEWVQLDRLIKSDDPSPFPALTQIELWGYEE